MIVWAWFDILFTFSVGFSLGIGVGLWLAERDGQQEEQGKAK